MYKILLFVLALLFSVNIYAAIDGLKESQSIFKDLPKTVSISQKTLDVSGSVASSKLSPINIISRYTAICSVSNNVVTFNKVGNCILVFTQAGDTNFMKGQKPVIITVTNAVPTIGISIDLPKAASQYTVDDIVTFEVTITGTAAPYLVNYTACGKLLGVSTAAPWGYSWKTTEEVANCDLIAEVLDTTQTLKATSAPMPITIKPKIITPPSNTLTLSKLSKSEIAVGELMEVSARYTDLTQSISLYGCGIKIFEGKSPAITMYSSAAPKCCEFYADTVDSLGKKTTTDKQYLNILQK